jgi:hypothetical protein
MDSSSQHKVLPSLTRISNKLGFSFAKGKKTSIWLLMMHAVLGFSGDRDRGGGAGGAAAVLRRVPHHRDAHVARRAHGAQGERSSPFASSVLLPL